MDTRNNTAINSIPVDSLVPETKMHHGVHVYHQLHVANINYWSPSSAAMLEPSSVKISCQKFRHTPGDDILQLRIEESTRTRCEFFAFFIVPFLVTMQTGIVIACHL